MTSNPLVEALDQRLREVVSELTDGVSTVTRWVMTYEVSLGADARPVFVTSSDNATLQDMAGLLRVATLEVDGTIQVVQRRQQRN